ncbi:MAG TPA: 2OG-Fe(II) oxygenase [Kofleriaceae bacterium]|nr:2OG-Fe(II) oxygenase [Kofleriaceae bacterium]
MAHRISIQEAIALAQAGDPEAQYALSSALHRAGKFDESLHWLRLAASRGVIPARLALAAMVMDGQRCTRDLQQARDLLQPLATTHIAANLLLAELHGFAAWQIGDRETGLRYLASAARMGDAGARRQLALLAACHRRPDLVDSSDWPAIEHAIPQLAGDLPLPAAEVLHESPLIRRFPAAVDPLVLTALIDLAAPLVQRSQIVDARTGESRADPMRTSSHVTLAPRQHDHVLEAIEQCIARVSGLPARNGEFVQVLRYRVGEEFKPHVDYFNESGDAAYRSLADGGQRAQTVLIYLNDRYTGGATAFPKLEIVVQGRPGDILHFHNVDAGGIGHKDSLHAGTPVETGEKWLLSKWIRSEAYPPRVRW